jgi:RluA family pseudouridine synthase
MPAVTNIAAYQFAALADLKPLRERLLARCKEWNLKGSILLSTEGINLFVAGGSAEIDALLRELRAVPGLENLAPKISESAEQPFTRMLVKIKKEIIAFGIDGIDPVHKPSPKLAAKELKRWLDEGRPLTLLDVRNDYEVKLGTFRNAIPIGIDHFTEFPEAVQTLPESLKKQPIVMFCTGGIRCEKAGPFMQRAGFEQVFQIDGGILKYFEECGGDHYDGECFVFDKRVSVDPSLGETRKAQCFACQAPLTEAEQADVRFVEGKSCPHCFRSEEEQRLRELEAHRAAIRRVTNPLPGREVAGIHDGLTLQAWWNAMFGMILSPSPAEGEGSRSHEILDSSHQAVTAERIVRAGERYYQRQPANIEPDVNVDIQILHEDDAIIVVNKPAPLPIHPSGRFNRNTLQAILCAAYAPQKPRPAHRLDANTTGVVVFTRTQHFAKMLQPQFERGEVEKQYLARVIGHPPEDHFICEAPIAADSSEVGGRIIDQTNGLSARTEFRVFDRSGDGTSLLEVTPRTGRTNQIRVHLWHLGWPILGDPLYLPGDQLGTTQTKAVGDPPMCLHAQQLTFKHPLNGERVTYEVQASIGFSLESRL